MSQGSEDKRSWTDEELIKLWKETGGRARLVSEATGITERNVYRRRAMIEKNWKIPLPSAGDSGGGRGDAGLPVKDYSPRVSIDGFVGVAVVSSDHHYWPDQPISVAHRALIEVIKDVKPGLNILNGDVFDGARLSRFPPNGWEKTPRVADELEAAKTRTSELRHAYRKARTIRTIGNHCIRFDRHLATNASEFEGVAGTTLAEHLLEWQECISVMVNGLCMIKHRFNGGTHAAYSNTLKAGVSMVTGHTHYLEVKPWGDYRGRRYGVQTGCVAEVDGPQFAYTEDNPTPWCSGFAVLTFDKSGVLMPPELCEVINGKAYFRGQIVC
jgi:hypothetical protein